MRVSQEEKGRSHARIVESAARLFRERGLDGASVADVMKEAGMTHGGFYKHFEGKDALVEAALAIAFDQFVAALRGEELDAAVSQVFPRLASTLRVGEAGRSEAAVRSVYLSDAHVAERGLGCPVAALGTEIARSSASIRRAFGAGVRRVVEAIAERRRGTAAARRAAAIREFSMLVGAVVIARASDPETGEEVLSACAGDARNDR